ncbi:TetR/AcrR family transcriptional regulator [Nocardioides caeni]|uniref:TetR/AcrR family transcriptional regulator n=1 Tax=Nocardioides caeni TaxID=574700 RepID=A0A4S8N0S6_9ACTN|nr:TetR/AcrR family transcriptional regulator [Nocardioides caeni]
MIAVARRLFVEQGYEDTSMASLAKAAGVAGNTIYWYFDDKDAILLAVLDAVFGEALADYEQVAANPLEEQLNWVVQRLQQMHRLVTTVHSRAAHSPAIYEWHTNFHAVTEGMFRAVLEQSGIDREGIEAEVRIGVFAVEGLLTHGLDEAQQRAICKRLAEQWTRI